VLTQSHNTWVDPKTAAMAAGVAAEVVRVWCRTGRVIARRLPGERGRWRVMVDADGFPVRA